MSRSPVYDPTIVSTEVIASIGNLCESLDITEAELREVLALPGPDRYSPRERPKADGTSRTVFNPDRRVRRIQRRINRRILADPNVIQWPDHVFGSIPNQEDDDGSLPKDYVACARVHCNAKSVLTLDIKEFFDNVQFAQVYEIFSKFFHYPTNVCEVLADICCLDGRLAQGALTSSYIATLALYDVEGAVVRRLSRKGLRYTRYVDDINISSPIFDYNFDFAKELISAMLRDKDLPLNSSKTRVQLSSTVPITVHGLRVGFPEPRLPGPEVRRIRAAVHNLECLAKEDSYRTSHSYRHDFNRCMGRVNKLARVGHKQHRQLVSRLAKIRPLPSKRDIERVSRMLDRLAKDHPTRKSTFWYSRRYYIAHERINVLRRTYSSIAAVFRARLSSLRPSYYE